MGSGALRGAVVGHRSLKVAVPCLLACGLGGGSGLGCAVQRQMLASPDDLADYRAFATAAREGARLASAQRYLERHPRGAWADEVRGAFDAEEPPWFDAAKVSRSRAREYVVDLPRGPHADAARALLLLFDEHQDDLDTLELLAASRRTAAMLDVEAARRKHVSDVVLDEVAALLDPPTWGAPIDDLPPLLASTMRGETPHTWGGAPPAHRDDRLFFVVPTPQGAQARDLDVRLQLWLDGGRVTEGVVQGPDLFVRWTEAMQARVLDPTRAADRRSAAAAVADVLSGALEAALPASRCAGAARDPAVRDDAGPLVTRACDGWSAVVRMGTHAGDDDAIDVRGKLVRAPAPGMR